MKDLEQKGYEAFIELWTLQGRYPTASQCPARYMKDEEGRREYLRGWRRAANEADASARP